MTILWAALKLCDGSSRPDFLRVGSIAGLGLGKSDLLRSASADPLFGRGRRRIRLFPFGGLSQLDTFEPEAPADLRGEARPIAPIVSGVQVSEPFSASPAWPTAA